MARTFFHKARRRFTGAALSLFKFRRRREVWTSVEAPRQGRLPDDQITIEVLRYRLDHPEAVVKNGNAVIYSNAFKEFLLKRLERKPEELTRRQFARAAGIPAVTLRSWLPLTGASLQTVAPTVARRKGIWGYILADDALVLWPSILKQNPRGRFAFGLFTAVLLHVGGLIAYQQLNREEEQVRTVRLMKYTEVVMPEIKAPTKQSWEEIVSSGRQPAAGMVARNFEVVKPRERRSDEETEASSEEAKVKKTGVLSVTNDDLTKDLDQVLSNQAMSTGRSLSSGRNGSSNGTAADMIELVGGLETGGGKNSIDEILKNDVAKNKPAVKLAKTGKVNVAQLSKVGGSKEALGARTDESLRKVLAENMGRLQYLYNKYLKTNPEIGGKVEVEVAINADGMVANAVVLASEITIADFQREIVAAIRRWRYDAITQGQVKVVYPIIFIKTS